jgi:hypothetical protein
LNRAVDAREPILVSPSKRHDDAGVVALGASGRRLTVERVEHVDGKEDVLPDFAFQTRIELDALTTPSC